MFYSHYPGCQGLIFLLAPTRVKFSSHVYIFSSPHRLMKSSSIAVETSRSTTQSDSIVRQTNKRSSCLYIFFSRCNLLIVLQPIMSAFGRRLFPRSIREKPLVLNFQFAFDYFQLVNTICQLGSRVSSGYYSCYVVTTPPHTQAPTKNKRVN